MNICKHQGIERGAVVAARRGLCVVVLGLSLWAGTDAKALMVPLGTTTLVDRASCIVEGRVTNLLSRWTDDHSAIVTEVVVEVTDVLLGDTNRVTFLYGGGVVDGLSQRVSDMPTLTNGQQVLVFLRPPVPEEARRDRPDAGRGPRYGLLGASQGLYRIEGARAKKEGFTVVGDSSIIDRNVDVTEIKGRIRERLDASGRKRGGQ